MLTLIQFALLYLAALLLAALGGMFSSRSGVFNFALEGVMLAGGLAGALTAKLLALPPVLTAVCSILIAGAAGMVFALPLGFMLIRLKGDPILAGTALNLLAAALASMIARGVTGGLSLEMPNEAFLLSLETEEGAAALQISVFLPIAVGALILSSLILHFTRLGLRLRACGDEPEKARLSGVRVAGTRYLGVMISGFLGGVGGLACVMPASSLWDVGQGMAGMGFLALTVMLLGKRQPLRIALAALALSLFPALILYSFVSSTLRALQWPREIYCMLPFIAALAALCIAGRRSRASGGLPSDPSMR